MMPKGDDPFVLQAELLSMVNIVLHGMGGTQPTIEELARKAQDFVMANKTFVAGAVDSLQVIDNVAGRAQKMVIDIDVEWPEEELVTIRELAQIAVRRPVIAPR